MLMGKNCATVIIGKGVTEGRSAGSGCVTNLPNPFNGSLKIWEWHGPWAVGHDELQHIGIGHFFHAAKIRHSYGDRPSHPGTTTDHDPTVPHMLFDPTDCFGQFLPVRFSKFPEGNPSVVQPSRSFDVELLSHYQHCSDPDRWLPAIIDVTDVQSISNLVHHGSV
jgi:hypothetical protein